MKKISNLLIVLSMFVMSFSGCSLLGGAASAILPGDTASAILPDDTTATIDDFQGTWQWKSEKIESTNQTKSTDLIKSLDFIIEENLVFMIPDSVQDEEIKFNATVENGVLYARNRIYGELKMTVKVGKTNMSVEGNKLYDLIGEAKINSTKIFDTTNLPFIPDTTVTFDNYEGTWTNTDKNVTFTFGKQSLAGRKVQLVNIVGLSSEFSMPNLVIVAKGVATTTINKDVYFMYMNKEHTGITVTGPKIKEQTGVLCFNLTKQQ